MAFCCRALACGDLGPQHAKLLLGGRLLCLGGGHGGVGLAGVGDRLVVGLARGPAACHQRAGAAGIGGGAGLLGLGLDDGGLRRVDRRLLLGTWRCAVSTAAAASAAAAVAWARRARQSAGSSTISGSPAWTRWLSATLMA